MAENSLRDENNITPLLTDRCDYCGITDKLKVCARCKSVYYCSKGHQQVDWPRHKRICKKLSQLANKKLENQSPESMGVVVNHIENLRLEARMENVTSADELNVDHHKDSTLHVYERAGIQAGKDATRDDYSDQDQMNVGSSEKFILESEENLIRAPNYSDFADTVSLVRESMAPNEMRQTNQSYFSVVESRNKALGEYVTNCLNSYGVCVIDNFLGDSKARDIWGEVNVLYRNKALSSGQLVNTVSPKGTVRGDLITWVEGTEYGCCDINFLISSIDAIMLHCQKRLDKYTVKGRSKAMVAVYPENSTGFLRHVDNPSGDGRCVTCIYYLNKNWNSKADGGLLRIFPEGQNRVANVEPKFDRLLFFWSDRRNPHEVLPSYRTRYAVTVWYYDEEERKKAVRKFKGLYHSKAAEGDKMDVDKDRICLQCSTESIEIPDMIEVHVVTMVIKLVFLYVK